jgi:NTP pyrophosphatase (non-canonical NTP hydrolase)
MTTQKIDSKKYIEFVQNVTSKPSSDASVLIDRIYELENQGIKLTHLLTFALGASAELGEAVEIIKKCLLQGKSFNEDSQRHLLLECSDALFYVAQLCIAMNVTFEDIMQMNYEKLSARYPEGTFSVYRSENRKEGDI